MKKTADRLAKQLKDYARKAGLKKTVIGLSGGVDSAVCAGLAAKALGKKNVHALLMPELKLTDPENIKHAVELCHKLGINYSVVAINTFVEPFDEIAWEQSSAAKMNTKARARMSILYNFANSHGCLVIGTSNKSERLLGYGTKHGDLAADIEVIGGLFKTDVVKLAEHLKIPEKIISKPPSAELAHGQTDENELGAPYFLLDQILVDLDKKATKARLLKKYDKKVVEDVLRRVESSAHKMMPVPMLRP
ncbi:NAD+ synthase [Candidatus Woesearchaeota archaeon]|nr:NAD+ synthase [Candidatus Woesearchaeota archaeon]